MAGDDAVALIAIVAALAAAGAVTGVLAGVFGVGGGLVATPVLYEALGAMGVDDSVRMHLCVGTSLAIVIPTAIRSFRTHWRAGAVDRDVLALWLWPVLVGVGMGALVAAFADSGALIGVFVIACAFGAVRFGVGAEAWRLGVDFPGRWAMRAIGAGIGFASTLMGIGGGLFGNLVYALFGQPIHRGVATSSGLGVIIAIPAAAAYVVVGLARGEHLPPWSLGYVSLIGVVCMAPLSMALAPFGARLAHRLSKRTLERLFAVYLILVAARFAAELL